MRRRQIVGGTFGCMFVGLILAFVALMALVLLGMLARSIVGGGALW